MNEEIKIIEKHWDKDFDKYINIEKHPSPFAKTAYEYIKNHNVSRMLEIGPGAGRDTIFFYMKNLEITALDISSRMLDYLREKLPNLQTIHADVKHGVKNLPEESYDCIYARLSIHYFNDEDTKAIFNELYRILKKGGLIMLEVRSKKDDKYNEAEMVDEFTFKTPYGGYGHLFTEPSLREKASRFKILEIQELRCQNSEGRDNCTFTLIGQK